MAPKQTVLLVEDEENDVFLTQRAVGKMGSPVSLQVARDGEEAIEYLAGQKKFTDRNRFPVPSLILLDIKMPRKNGFDVLQWLREDQTLAHIPVVIVSSSKVKSDVDKAHELGARAYLVKPVAFQELQQLLTATEEFLSVHTG